MSVETPASDSVIRRLDGIQLLRGIAAVAVVLGHLAVMERKYSPDQLLGNWAELGAAGVDLFFVISGFIMVYVTQDRGRVSSRPAGFFAGRVFRIYPLYWAVSAALLCVWLVRPDLVFSSAVAQPDLIKSAVLWPDIRPPLLAVGWTLIHEMYFYIVFTGFLVFARKWLPLLLLAWAGVTLGGIAAGLNVSSYEGRLVFNPLTLEFITGAFAGLVFIKSEGRFARAAFAGGAMLMTISLVVLAREGGPNFEEPWVRVSYFALPATVITYGLAGLGLGTSKIRYLGVALGNWSYALYLTHILSLSLVGYVWARASRNGYLDNVVALIAMGVFAILVSALAHIVFEKPVLRISQSVLRRLKLRD